MTEKSTAKNNGNSLKEGRQISAKISAEAYDKIEGYAYGTRRKVSDVLRDAVNTYLEANAKDISAKSV